jgi:hypothetical protein
MDIAEFIIDKKGILFILKDIEIDEHNFGIAVDQQMP